MRNQCSNGPPLNQHRQAYARTRHGAIKRQTYRLHYFSYQIDIRPKSPPPIIDATDKRAASVASNSLSLSALFRSVGYPFRVAPTALRAHFSEWLMTIVETDLPLSPALRVALSKPGGKAAPAIGRSDRKAVSRKRRV